MYEDELPPISRTMADCGLDGSEDEPVTVAKINRFIRLANIYHIVPIKRSITDLELIMQEHIKADEAMHNQIKGAKTALWVIAIGLMILIPSAWAMYDKLSLVAGLLK